jgi:thiamine biosynthesis lipoprotein
MMTRCKVFLGTYVEISIRNQDGAFKSLALEAINEAFQEIAMVDKLMNIHQKDSELSKINRLAPLGITKLHPCIQEVLLIAGDLYRQSNGLFDCTYDPKLDHCSHSFDDIEWLDKEHIHFKSPISINLNGIAKGYAVDKAVEVLENFGITNGLVNAGGDLRLFGDAPALIYIRNPINPLLANAIGNMNNVSIASSGNYLQAHLFNPQRKSTIRTDSSFTVIAPQCVYADGLTKVLASLGHSKHPCFSHYNSIGLVIKG